VANIQPQKQSRLRNLVKFLVAVLVLVLLWAFFNDSTYNLLKKKLVKNSDRYMEMYAYTKSKPAFMQKYFILQGNDAAKTFFKKEVAFTDESSLDKIQCSDEEILLIYEKPSQKISEFVKKREGEEIIFNQGTNIEFFIAKVRSTKESCSVGG